MTKLTIGTIPFTQWHPLEPILLAFGWQNDQTPKPELWLSNPQASTKNSTTLLLYSNPINTLAEAIRSGTPPSQALADWLEHTQNLVSRFRQNRKSTLVIHSEQARANPQALIKVVQQHFGLTTFGQITPAKPELTPAKPQDGAYLLAHYLLHTSEAANELLNLLEASTTPLADNQETAVSIEPDALYKQLQQSERVKELQQKSTDLEQENQLIIEQLHKVQEELEQRYLSQKDLEANLTTSQNAQTKAEQALKAKTTELTKLQAKLKQTEQQASKSKDLEEENQLILEQLFKVQEELEQYYLNNKALQNTQAQTEAQLKRAENDLAKAQQKLERLTHSASWKLTAPARAITKPFRKASPEARSLKKQAQIIRDAKALDENWYTQTYPDIAQNGADPVEHYLRFGAEENRNPSPAFDTAWYKSQNPDVAEAEVNPLVHYIKFGKEEGRQPKP